MNDNYVSSTLRYHTIRCYKDKCIINIIYITTEPDMAAILTKALDKAETLLECYSKTRSLECQERLMKKRLSYCGVLVLDNILVD